MNIASLSLNEFHTTNIHISCICFLYEVKQLANNRQNKVQPTFLETHNDYWDQIKIIQKKSNISRSFSLSEG